MTQRDLWVPKARAAQLAAHQHTRCGGRTASAASSTCSRICLRWLALGNS